jgi:hypothetical protein
MLRIPPVHGKHALEDRLLMPHPRGEPRVGAQTHLVGRALRQFDVHLLLRAPVGDGTAPLACGELLHEFSRLGKFERGLRGLQRKPEPLRDLRNRTRLLRLAEQLPCVHRRKALVGPQLTRVQILGHGGLHSRSSRTNRDPKRCLHHGGGV